MSFVPIKLGDYVRLFPKSNRGENAKAVTARLRSALEAYKAGERCDCGEPIWVVGSAEAGHSCFTCITGEADPSEDYEIAEACYKASVPSRGGRRHGRAYQQHVSTPGNAARPPLPASPRRPRHPQIPPSTKASPTTTCRSKIACALEHGQETAAAYLPAGEEAVPPTKHGDAIVCATTACVRARLGTPPIRRRAQRAPRQGADAQLLMAFCLNSIRTDFDRQEGCPASRNRVLKPIAVSGPRKKALSGPIRGSYSSQP